MPIQWVVFDAVGTLIFATPGVAAAYHEIGQRHGSQLSQTDVSERFRSAIRNSETLDLHGGGSDITSEEIEETRWRRIVSEVLPDVISPDVCFEDLFRHFGESSSWACFDDVEVTIGNLTSGGLQLAMASNFDARLHSVCDGLSEMASVSHRVVSSEVGFRKPSRSFYDALLSQIGASPDEVLMVGDDLANDVRGAEAAGIQAILIDRAASSEIAADVTTVKSLLELESVLS